jgi:hypothetical protein
MILNRAFAAPSDKDHLLNTRLACLIDCILDERTIHDGQHFLRYCLGRWQEARAKPGNRKHRFFDFLSFKWQNWVPEKFLLKDDWADEEFIPVFRD